MKEYIGSCFCGNIQFKTEGDPLFTQHCHCEKCREIAALSQRTDDKIGYSFTAAYLAEKFKIIRGKSQLKMLQRNHSDLLLCSTCKSLIYGISQDPAKQAGIGINVNNFNFDNTLPPSFKPDKHIWYQNRVVDIEDDLPKYMDAPREQFGTGELYKNEKPSI